MASKAKLITQPEDWWAAFEAQAELEDLSLAKWVGECCKANLPKSVAEVLSDRPTVGAPKRPKSKD